MRKRILFVLPYWIRGGAEKQFKYIYEGISRHHDIDIFLLNRDNDNDLKNKNIYYIENKLFNEGSKIKKVFNRIFDYIRIKKYISKYVSHYDYVIGHNKLIIPIMPMFKDKTNKIIFSAREADEEFSKGILGKILGNIDLLTCNSEATYEILTKVNTNVYFINNGVNLTRKNKIKYMSLKKIAVIANLSRRKNVKLAIEALKYIPEDITLDIAGKISDYEYYEEINEYINNNNLKYRVKLHNFIEDMNSFYKNTDLVILPSFSEGTSNVILECFAKEKLILMSNIKENSTLVKEEYKDFIMFNPNDEKDLADKIISIKELIDMKNKTINNILDFNYDLIEREYSIKTMQKKYLDLIR